MNIPYPSSSEFPLVFSPSTPASADSAQPALSPAGSLTPPDAPAPPNSLPAGLELVGLDTVPPDPANLDAMDMNPANPNLAMITPDAPEMILTPVAAVTVAEAAALPLTPSQREAISKLTTGHTRLDAARAAGVSRMTLYRWLREDAAFQAVYNAWQSDVLSTAQGQLLAGTREAVATVLNAIRLGDSKLAWKLLESQGITARPQPGTTDIDELERQAALHHQKQQIADRRERNQVLMDDLATPDGL